MIRQYATPENVALLRERVKKHNSLMQKDLAAICGEHQITLYRKMVGKMKMPIEQYRKIDKAVNK